MDINHKLVYQINKLVQIHQDRILGYEKARTLVHSKYLKDLFEQCISQSDTYATKLKSTMLFHGVKMEVKPSFMGMVFRGWMQFRASWSRNKDFVVLKSCREGEKVMAVNYDLLCENKSLQYYFPLLKYTFMKQQFALKQTREYIDTAIQSQPSIGASVVDNRTGVTEIDAVVAGT